MSDLEKVRTTIDEYNAKIQAAEDEGNFKRRDTLEELLLQLQIKENHLLARAGILIFNSTCIILYSTSSYNIIIMYILNYKQIITNITDYLVYLYIL